MKIKLQKGTFETCIMFILSPFLSIPFIFVQLKRGKDRLVTLFISLIMGLLSYLYIPFYSDDKSRYIERFELFNDYSFTQLKDYFAHNLSPDYFFDLVIFSFTKFNVSFHYLFFLFTTITVYSVFIFVQKTNEKLLNKSFYFTISFALIVLLSFSLPGLFSGIRFVFAGSIFIWAIYYLFIDKTWFKGVLFFVVAILTHFSFAFFIPPVLLLLFYPKRLNPKIILLISLFFLFFSKNLLSEIFSLFGLPESYALKAEGYLTSESESDINFQILAHLRNMWAYFSYFFVLFLNKDKKSRLLLVFVVLLSFINMTYSIPVVYNRYLIIPKILLVTFLINSKIRGNIKSLYFYLYYAFIILSVMIDIYVLRPSIFASYKLIDMLTVIQVLSDKFEFHQIL